MHEEHTVQSKSLPSSSKKKTNSSLNNDDTNLKDPIRQLQYTLAEDEERFEEDIKSSTQLNSTTFNSKVKATDHPFIRKYTNNPYKATSTLSFYNHMADTK